MVVDLEQILLISYFGMILIGFQTGSLTAEGSHSRGFGVGRVIVPKDSYWENFGALKLLCLPLIWRLINIQNWIIAANNSYLCIAGATPRLMVEAEMPVTLAPLHSTEVKY